VHTSANHEKRVALHLGQRSVEHFLPLYDSQRRWKDRRVQLQLPLFPGYVFVHFALRDRLQVLQIPGVAKLVGFSGTPAALPLAEIEALRTCVARKVGLEPHAFVHVGRRVRVKAGPLEGLEGIVTRKKNRLRFVIAFDLIQRCAAVEMDGAELEPVGRGLPYGRCG
jgi:transcription antitermination factor NusG